MSMIHPTAEGQRHPKEARDCTVRALANATGMDYLQAHALLVKHGRRTRAGAVIATSHGAYIDAGLQLVQVYGRTVRARIAGSQVGQRPGPGITLGRLLPQLQQGRYIVMITGHALAVVDGKTIDTGPSRAGSSVFALYRLP